MRSRNRSELRAAAAREAEQAELVVQYDTARARIAMSMIADILDHHAACRFKACRRAGWCMSLHAAEGVCPMPLDTNRALMFVGMIRFHDAMHEAELEALREGRAAQKARAAAKSG